MTRDPISALDEAIAGLEMELAANPRFVLLQSLKTARAAFPTDGTSRTRGAANDATSPSDRPSGRQMNPARKQALEMSEEMLREEGGIIKSKDIYSRIEERGVKLPGGANNLASLLGRFPKTFVSHGRQGWTLKVNEPHSETAGGSDTATEDGGASSVAQVHSGWGQAT